MGSINTPLNHYNKWPEIYEKRATAKCLAATFFIYPIFALCFSS
jgi:hypothetical protein